MTAAEDLILAACLGQAEFEAALGGQPPRRGAAQALAARPDEAGVWIQEIEVAGFRGIGPKASLSVAPRPGLTLVVGRNGSGKSSFAEAVEFLLTGRNYRWEDRSKIWSQGWRNLHQPDSRIGARFALDGQAAPTVVEATWAQASELIDAERRVSSPKNVSLAELGWHDALENFRPFLSYNELGTLLDEGPTKLYDALAGILGLQDLVLIQKMLAEDRLMRVGRYKQAADALPPVLTRLIKIDDLRARACAKALLAKKWDLDVVELALRGATDEGDVETELGLLRQFSTLASPNLDRIAEVATELRTAANRLASTAKTDSGRAKRTMKLLKDALILHKHQGDGDCPVCHRPGALTERWRDAAQAEVDVLAMAAAEAEEAEKLVKTAFADARTLLTLPPTTLERAPRVGLEAQDLIAAWSAFYRVPADDDLTVVATHLEHTAAELASVLDRFRARAQQELDRRENAWRPIAHELDAWLAEARPAIAEQAIVPALRAAEKWMKEATGTLRDERFAPIADRVDSNWRMLRQNSSVTLGKLRLEGAGNQRRVSLDIDIDGQPSAALAVMSQGEINSLALSLFLPRATLDESPFRFVVIDDPVQSMDPSKVDGLARVLQAAAQTRQVIVLTHDDRLPQAIWRLDVPATILEVTRRQHSVVEVRTVKNLAERYLEDARAVAADQHLPMLARHVVPGFCRQAVEESCAQIVWRRRLRAGNRHQDIEDELSHVTTVNQWMALALFDDSERGGDVMSTLNKRQGPWAGDLFSRLKKGAHEGDTGDLKGLIKETQHLTGFVASLNS